MTKEILTNCGGIKVAKGITELVFILDKSGSMAGKEGDTIGDFNGMIEKQKLIDGKVFVSTFLFSNCFQILHDRKTLEEIKPLTEEDYQVGGCTALLDAVGKAIAHIGNIHKYAREEDIPARTLFVITTDGMENASRVYGRMQIKDMIREKEEKCGWEFLFLAANIDAVESAESIGIKRERAVNYSIDEEIEDMYEVLSDSICGFRLEEHDSFDSFEKNIKRRKNKI